MRKQSETLLLVPLLPIFLVGMFPMLVLALLGFAGLGLFGILLICAGLTDALEAHNDFNRHVIVEGYARRSDHAIHASNLAFGDSFGDCHASSRRGIARRGPVRPVVFGL